MSTLDQGLNLEGRRLLEQGKFIEFNELREVNREWIPFLKEIDLSGQFLPFVNLTLAQMYKANLSGAILDEAKFDTAYLWEANFTEARITNASLWRACLQGTCFKNAYVSGSKFDGADLTNANLEGIRGLMPAQISWATITGALLPSKDIGGEYLENVKKSLRYPEQ